MKQEILTHEYTMMTHKVLRHCELLGSVIQMERDWVRVHLDIDKAQEATAAY
ncbi:hypothetical protein [Paenibacillus massiliensis]|uniref:hypothetical protein n=1 Tax=Paenibacillus massiliensis TaxID=225917 RepID=UPI000412A7D3|nr:hypothetical protein [Paenibacillus massiliensis]